jgi:hypothetical protein
MWLSLLSAITGAVIATASSAFLDHRRWRRDQAQHLTDIRRVIYAEYLATLSKARNQFRSLAREPDLDPKQREESARTIFAPCYEVRYQVTITASDKVITTSEQAFRRLRDVRDFAAAGTLMSDETYTASRGKYEAALADLREAMRGELGSDRV